MSKIISKEKLQLYRWLAAVYFFVGLFNTLSKYSDRFVAAVFNNLWMLTLVTAINVVLFEYSVPFVLRKRRFLLYNIVWGFLLVWLHLLCYAFGLYVWRGIGVQLHTYTALTTYQSVDSALENATAYGVGSAFFFGIIRHIYFYNKLRQSTQQLRIEKQEAELNYLRSQTNPHFLFNTLNNIYSLARAKDDLAPKSILRLSKILRFMLYETSGDYIAIEQELKILNDYIALEQLRYDESLRINFNHDVEDMKQALPPLLLMPLVENAFKHGVSETRNCPFVDIHLSVKQRQLTFVVKNSSESNSEEQTVKESIGLSNLRRQLNLLYTDSHLSVQQSDFVFTATLKINLVSHV